MNIFDKDFKEIFFGQMGSLTGGLIAGTILAVYTNKLLLIPGMLVLLPGFLDMRGNISGAFASRLSSGLFLGIIKPNRKKTKIIRGNLIATFLLAVFVSIFLGWIAFLFSYFVLHLYAPQIILLPLIAGIIANAVEIPLTFFITIYFFEKGHDPNNIMGPVITSVGDIAGVVALLIALAVI